MKAEAHDPNNALRNEFRQALKAAARRLAEAIKAGVPEHELAPYGRVDWDRFESLRCGARTRAGTPCKRHDLYRSGRCSLHGGKSTGPVTAEGKARSSANGKRTP